MKKSLASCLVASVLSFTGMMVAPQTAHADGTDCTPFVEKPPQTIGALGQVVHMPGVKARVCYTSYGDQDLTHIINFVTPRIAPGTCDASVFDPVCLTVFVDWGSPPGYSNVTLETYIDGVAQPPISVDIPRYPLSVPGTTCVLSIGYSSAPTRPCLVARDLGQ